MVRAGRWLLSGSCSAGQQQLDQGIAASRAGACSEVWGSEASSASGPWLAGVSSPHIPLAPTVLRLG